MSQPIAILPQPETAEQATPTQPKPYTKPRLETLGDLRTLTLGVSGAPIDSSGGTINQKTL